MAISHRLLEEWSAVWCRGEVVCGCGVSVRVCVGVRLPQCAVFSKNPFDSRSSLILRRIISNIYFMYCKSLLLYNDIVSELMMSVGGQVCCR